MKYKLNLPFWMEDCPVYWKNFTSTCGGPNVDAELKKYNATLWEDCYDSINEIYVLFDTAEDATAFKLRFA